MNPPWYILDSKGRPVPADLETFGQWCATAKTLVAMTPVLPAVMVCTHYTGLNHLQFDPPRLWETLVEGGDRHGQKFSWASRAEAEAGHERVVAGLLAEYQ